MKRFTKKQAELADKISNDISEGIDCRESKKDLRMAVDYWASVACDESMKRASAEAKLNLVRTIVGK